MNNDFERAYNAGRLAAKKQASAIVCNPIEAPMYERIHASRYAEALKDAFQKGVRDEQQVKRETP